MKGSPQLKNFKHRVYWLLFIMFVYCLGNAIPLPFVEVTRKFTHIMNSSPLGLISLMGGSNFTQITLFSIGINPMMIAMILMQVLTMSGFMGFDALSQKQQQVFQQFATLILAILQSIAVVWGLQLIPHRELDHCIMAVIILTTGAMFVNWLGTMNSLKGIGGTVTLILINISVGMLPRIRQAVHIIERMDHPYLMIAGLMVLALGLVYFWIAFSYAYYPMTLINVMLPSYSKPLTMPIGMNTGAMMMYMMGMGLITLPMMAGQIYQIKFLQNPYVNMTLAAIIAFVLFYFFTYMQFNPKSQAKMLRNQNNYILGIRPGLPTQKYINKRLFWVSLPGALLNTFQLAFGFVGTQVLGDLGTIAFIPMTAVMIVLFMFGIKDMILTLLIPYQYERVMKKEG